jgi:hypothetical protein
MQADEQQARAFAGRWWRFDSYQLVGRMIRPAPGASLASYDPWERRGQAPPYVELARLGEAIDAWHRQLVASSLTRFQAEVTLAPQATRAELATYLDQLQAALAGAYGASAEPPAETRQLIVAFCARFGLLGLFQQETLALNLESAAEALLDFGEFSGDAPGEQLLSRYRRFERTGGGWRTLSLRARTRVAKGTQARLPRRSWAELVGSSAWPLDESQLPASTVLRRGRARRADLPPALDQAPLAQVRGTYFAAAGRGFPEPNSEEFWRAYGEDAVSFAGYAGALAAALSGVQAKGAKARAAHLAQLNDLLAPVALVLGEEQGLLRSRFVSPSLIGTLAAMAFFDIAGGVRFAHCERCAKLFSSRRADRRFCSPRCQDAAKSRRRYQSDAAHRRREQTAARQRAAARAARAASESAGGAGS